LLRKIRQSRFVPDLREEKGGSLEISGLARLDKRTKNLIPRLNSGDIAIIDHKDLDEVAAESLCQKKVGAVINCAPSISGRYPNLGPGILLKNNIPLYEVVTGDPFKQITENTPIKIIDEMLYIEGERIASLTLLTLETIETALKLAEENLAHQLNAFVDNTLQYAAKEKGLIIDPLPMPETALPIHGAHTLLVVRGKSYKEDLITIMDYIKARKPILIGVDGGGDALLEFGLIPDLLIGDMDSVSDRCLKASMEIIVHAYPNGEAPGMERIQHLGLKASLFPAPGTSEDIAMLYAFEKGAELIVVVGTHSHMIDFLEKGRKGMGSTFLVRMKIGTKLVDAKGVSQLYTNNTKGKHIMLIAFASLIPILIVAALSEPTGYIVRLLYMQIRLYLGL